MDKTLTVPALGQIHDTYGTYVCMRRICPRAGTQISALGCIFGGTYYFTEFSSGCALGKLRKVHSTAENTMPRVDIYSTVRFDAFFADRVLAQRYCAAAVLAVPQNAKQTAADRKLSLDEHVETKCRLS